MRIYYAKFPFEVDQETGASSLYSPTLLHLRRQAREFVTTEAANESTLRYYCKPLGPAENGRVPIEISVEVEQIETTKITKGLFCGIVNGGGGFVKSRRHYETLVYRFIVPAELFGDR